MKISEQQYSRHVSVPSDEGIRVDKAITIERPPAEVYAFWRRLENLPRFMSHLESVQEQDELHSHWAVKAIAGKVLEWDAEIIEQREGEMISWRSLPGADVDHAGSVWFTPLPGGQGTVVRVELKYVPPAGKTGDWVAKLFRRDAASEIGDDLLRLKTFLETGELPKPTGVSSWARRTAEATRGAARATDHYVRENAWVLLACVAVACFAGGFIVGQKRK